MPPIEDYALLSGGGSAALLSRAGSVYWLCWPRFDSPACCAALLGTEAHGSWQLGPAAPGARTDRRYLDGSMVLETLHTCADGVVAVVDLMPFGGDRPALIRIVEGRSGGVALRSRLALRFGYGAVAPWLRQTAPGEVTAVAGPDLAVLRAEADLVCDGGGVLAQFTVRAGERVTFVLQHGPSHLPPPAPLYAEPALTAALTAALGGWRAWSARSTYRGRYAEAVNRSLLTLKALIYQPTGGMVAAPSTSLPEQPGGTRNWDYRYCWLRDSALAVRALLRVGHLDEAQAWQGWLHRAIGGDPARLRIMYGLAGEPNLPEWEASWLPGYQGARPVRIGNAAHDQLQIDVFGEVLDALHATALAGSAVPHEIWNLQRGLIARLEQIWQSPDEGIWETRGGRRRFTFSQVMAWAALDRAIASAEAFGLPAPLAHWRALRATMHATICRDGFDAAQNSFTQSFGRPELDASALQIPIMGFLPPNDPRVRGTVAAIERHLLRDGLMQRYRSEAGADGLPPGEGAFLACSYWLVEVYALQGRIADARALFERLLALRNDVGLLSEEIDPTTGRQLGNFPQAFSHLALINAAVALGES